MAKKERLTCHVTGDVKSGIADYGMSLSQKKGSLTKAYRVLLALAYAEPDAPAEYFAGEEDASCTLDANVDEVTALRAYQTHHRIGEQRKGFKSALLRGFSIQRARAASAAAAAAVTPTPSETGRQGGGADASGSVDGDAET